MEKQAPETALMIETDQWVIPSDYLGRDVLIDIYRPSETADARATSLLFMNDGQDLPGMDFANMLSGMTTEGRLRPLIVAGIHCGPDRKLEYGTSCTADYLGRGSKAGLYQKCIFDEVLPLLRRKYDAPSFLEKSFAGFSLGGLSALDLVWNHATEFTKAGVFSGSLWWRRKAYEDGYSDESDRIMHLQVRKGGFYPWLRFFFECGAMDETADRNQNGVIDAIDDTLDLIIELKARGYTDDHIRYLELECGKHDCPTWAEAMPAFLEWGWSA